MISAMRRALGTMHAVLVGISLSPSMLSSQSPARPGINYDESRVAPYTLPDPLVFADGKPVRTVDEWRTRRAELLGLFEREVYGKAPPAPRGMWHEVRATDRAALGGRATRKEVRVHLAPNVEEPYLDILLYVPNGRRKPAPVFLALTYGNHTITTDSGVRTAHAHPCCAARGRNAGRSRRSSNAAMRSPGCTSAISIPTRRTSSRAGSALTI